MRLAAVLALLALAGAITFGVFAWIGERKMKRVVEVRVVPVPYTKDRAALRQGKYLFETRGCAECHGTDGRGLVVVDTPSLFVKAPNITAGPGSSVADYNEGDWVRTIRHGVDPQGRALFLMPCEGYNRMSDADLAALVAFVRSLPPVKGESAEVRLPLHLRALYGAGILKDAAERIDHRRPPSPAVAPGVNPEYGAYVAAMCIGCHRANYAGGPIDGAPPEWPPAANLTGGEGSIMPAYPTPEAFIVMMRTGKRPGGSEVNRAMPFLSLRNLNDTDLAAIYSFLKTLPPRRIGER